MSDQFDLKTTGSAVASATTETAAQSATGDSTEEGVAALHAEIADLQERIQSFARSYPGSRSLREDIESFLAIVMGHAEEIGKIGIIIDDTNLRTETSAERELESYAGEIEREVADVIDELLNGPDLSLRTRFEELRQRLSTGETGFVLTERNSFQSFRDAVSQICMSIR